MKNVRLQIDYALAREASRGALFSKDELASIAPNVDAAAETIERERHSREELAFLDLPYAYGGGHSRFGDRLAEARSTIERAAAEIRQTQGDFVHVAIGGSALGSITLRDALRDPRSVKEDCRIFVPDNVDPEMITSLLQQVRPERTFVHVVSKSGDTVETIANFAVVYKFLQDRGLDEDTLRQRVFVTTNPERGGLAALAHEFGFTVIPLPDEIHGRFSVLSPSGLFGAAVGGVDLDDLLAGAREADAYTSQAGFWDNPARLLAALHYLGNTTKGLSSLILLPYVQALRTIADWYSQLVAESLGKEGKGMTPVKALGATDQHSQLQLYNDGPHDKLVIFFGVDRYRTEVPIPEIFAHQEIFSFLRHHSLNDLIDAERRGTAVSLFTHGVPSCTFMLDVVSPGSLAALLIILEKTVCILGELYGVNAFDQPGVEESKEYARAMLGKEGERYDVLRRTVAGLSS